jgi:putative phosphoribosyl transferase
MQTQRTMRFRSREEAGRQLADKLASYAKTPDVVVLAMPCDGVPVGTEIAEALEKPFDVLVIGPITAPGDGTLLGAITAGGVRMLNCAKIDRLHLSQAEVNSAVLEGSLEIARREKSCRGAYPHVDVADRTVILVDDGTTSCELICDAIRLLRRQHAEHIIVAVPAVCRQTAGVLRLEADHLVTLMESEDSLTVGGIFKQLPHLTEAKVRRLLAGKCPTTGIRN